MKKIFLFLFTFAICLQVSSQTTVSARDSSYLLLKGSVYYEVRDVVYPSGDFNISGVRIGALSDVINKKVADFERQSEQMAEIARVVSKNNHRITEIIREGNAAKELTNASPLDTLQARFISPFLTSGWTIKSEGKSQNIIFSVTNVGELRYSLDGGAKLKAEFLGTIIRLQKFPTSKTTNEDIDFYIDKNANKYVDILDRFTLKAPKGEK